MCNPGGGGERTHYRSPSVRTSSDDVSVVPLGHHHQTAWHASVPLREEPRPCSTISLAASGYTADCASGGVDASGGFAPLRVVWICVLWALFHSILASKQAKDLAHRIS